MLFCSRSPRAIPLRSCSAPPAATGTPLTMFPPSSDNFCRYKDCEDRCSQVS
jgi:hypothetical protein